MTRTLRDWARSIKRDVLTLWFAYRHPDTPLIAKILAIAAAAYALSPIDLIPDFIPVLGYLDDLIIVPALVWITMRLLPAHVIDDCRRQAADWMAAQGKRPKSYAGAIVIACVWIALIVWLVWALWDEIRAML